jgi:hypothetical protein
MELTHKNDDSHKIYDQATKKRLFELEREHKDAHKQRTELESELRDKINSLD